jgi:tetratricopeptide (TPR) repeat protein
MKAVKLAFSSRDDKGLASAYTALARSYLEADRYSLAIKNINDALSPTRAGKGATLELYNLAARIYLRAGRFDEAGAMIEKALNEVSREGGAPSAGVSGTYRVKAGILSKKGDSISAITYFDMAYAVDVRLGDEKNMALDLWGSAVVLMDLGRYNEAIIHLKKSFLLYRKSNYIKGAIIDIDKLVELYTAIGDKSSESYYRNMRDAIKADMR